MKRLIFILIAFICLNSYAQTLKTYNGQFRNPNSHSMVNYGKATYTYREGDDKRIFHGNFSYSDKDRTLRGKFIDDKQDGIWTLSEKTNFYSKKHYYNGRIIISVTYKNGIPNGPFSISLIDSKSNRTINFIKAHFSNGKLVGKVTGDLNERLFDFWGNHFDSVFDVPYHNRMSGNFSEEGMPIDIWVVTSPTCKITEVYSSDGYNVTTYDPSTGDNISDNRPAHMPNMIVEAANFALRRTHMRSSEEIQLPTFNLNSYARPFNIEATVFQEVPDSVLRPPKGHRPPSK